MLFLLLHLPSYCCRQSSRVGHELAHISLSFSNTLSLTHLHSLSHTHKHSPHMLIRSYTFGVTQYHIFKVHSLCFLQEFTGITYPHIHTPIHTPTIYTHPYTHLLYTHTHTDTHIRNIFSRLLTVPYINRITVVYVIL